MEKCCVQTTIYNQVRHANEPYFIIIQIHDLQAYFNENTIVNGSHMTDIR